MRKKTQKVCLGQGEDAFYTTKKSCKAAVSKKRVLKIMGASGLAFIMGIGTLCGVLFAPAGGSVASSINSQSSQLGLAQSGIATAQSHNGVKSEGLITPQENDPVIFTTESGIDIKFALASVTINSSLSSGNLSGFPYFTTTGTGGTYTWVIIGVTSKINEKYFRLSSIKGYAAALTKNYFSSCYETTTPAGAVISDDNLLNDYVYDYWTTLEKYKSVLSQRKQTDEIPNGCVLCILNGTAGYEYRHSNGGGCGAGELSTKTGCSLEELGLSTISSHIIPTTVKRRGWDGSVSTQQNLTLFSMGSSYSTTFKLGTYLTNTQLKLSVSFWCGDNHNNSMGGYYFNTNGDVTLSYGNIALRPAFVLSLV